VKKIIINGGMLAAARERQRLTQDDFAEKMGISRQTVVTWEAKTELKITSDQLKTVETCLNVTFKDLTKDVTRGTNQDILDHPVIKELVEQSQYIRDRVKKLETENANLRSRLGE
jgi:transcriptional regulator with XRE-family HTH domain